MSLSYKGFTFNDANSPEPWTSVEVQAWKDLADTLVLDAIGAVADTTNGHRHATLYLNDASAAAVSCGAEHVTVAGKSGTGKVTITSGSCSEVEINGGSGNGVDINSDNDVTVDATTDIELTAGGDILVIPTSQFAVRAATPALELQDSDFSNTISGKLSATAIDANSADVNLEVERGGALVNLIGTDYNNSKITIGYDGNSDIPMYGKVAINYTTGGAQLSINNCTFFEDPGDNLTIGGISGYVAIDTTLLIKESAAALADAAGYGQFWVENGSPNWPRFTDDGGTDYHLVHTTGATGGSGSAGAGNEYVAMKVGSTTYKVLIDGTV